ncbi:hypothetical protein ACICHK_18475 [Streptomyces sp. AHU1]|uniref:hypothetical protein n=1 Tax=Streptomyces sp. AHU1 TaxID=3377215 RepID=UPI0038782EC0
MRDKTQANSPEAGDGLIRAGAIVFFVGALATLVTVAPLLLGTKPFPFYMFGLSMLMGVGFVLAAAGVLRSAADGRRRARAARS